MRPVLHGDVSNAARALLNVPRVDLCTRMMREAEAADVFAHHSGQLHPLWGNGSLMAASRKRMLANEPTFDDVDYCDCFEMVLRGLVNWRASPQRSQCR